MSPLQPIVEGLSFPTSLTFDEDGVVYLAESGLPFAGAPAGGRVSRLDVDGSRVVLAEGLRPPVTGLTWHDGGLYVSEAGHPSRISRLAPDGTITPLVSGFPGPGNYHLNMTAVGPDGRLYFSQGALTNLGIVGLDAYQLGWLRQLPHAHDVPGLDVELSGANVETENPLADDATTRAITGAFVPFGTPTRPGQRIPAGFPPTAALLRCDPDGANLELVAWGLRNAFAIGFLPDGRLLAIDQGADDRGSRPVGEAPDLLFELSDGAWYGWPDFIGGVPVTEEAFRPTRGPRPEFVLRNHHELPPPQCPLLRFPPHVAAVKFAVAPRGTPLDGHLVVALFGDEAPLTAPAGPRVGRSLALVDPRDWSLRCAPAGLFTRPIDVRFHPRTQALHVLDFGHFEMTDDGVAAEPATGRLWRLDPGEESQWAG